MFWKKGKKKEGGDDSNLSPESLYMGDAPAKPPARRKPETAAPVAVPDPASVEALFGSDLPPPRKKTPAPQAPVAPLPTSADDFLFSTESPPPRRTPPPVPVAVVLKEEPLPGRAPPPMPREPLPEVFPDTDSLTNSAKPSSWTDRTGFKISQPIFPPKPKAEASGYTPSEDVPEPAPLSAASASTPAGREAQEITLEAKPAPKPPRAAPPPIEEEPLQEESTLEEDKPRKKWAFGNKSAKEKQTKPQKLGKSKNSKTSKQRSTGLKEDAWRRGDQGTPIQLFIGFLPEAEARDAKEYAFGVAERNATNPISALYGILPYNGGYAYEVHEGGHGKAYLPSVIEFFNTLGPFNPGEGAMAHIRTASRTVQVERTRQGLVAFLLPEKDDTLQSTWLNPGKALKPAISLKKGMLGVGAGVFIMGALALISAILVVPMLPKSVLAPIGIPPPMIPYHTLPISQWDTLIEASQRGPVGALKFEGGKWIVQPEVLPTGPAPVPPPVPTPGGN